MYSSRNIENSNIRQNWGVQVSVILLFVFEIWKKILNSELHFSHFSGLFFEKHLRYIKLSEHFVSFTKMNLTHLLKV